MSDLWVRDGTQQVIEAPSEIPAQVDREMNDEFIEFLTLSGYDKID